MFIASACLTLAMISFDKQVTIYTIGDSTMAEKNLKTGTPERGWGMVLQGCFDEGVRVENHAVNGQSSKSFIDGGRWQKVVERIKPGDYVFIQFGHNDEKARTDRHTDPGSTFDDNLRRYVNETRAKGGIPVLFNAVVRRNFYNAVDTMEDEHLRQLAYDDGEEKVNSDTLVDTHGEYARVPRRIAQEMGVAFVDANKLTHDLEQSLGIAGSRKLHMWFKPGEHPAVPNGRKDNTHYNVYGAHVVANMMADAIAEQVPALKRHVCHYDYVVSAEGRGNYMTLQEAVDAVSAGKKVKILVLDGTWTKPSVPKGKRIKIVAREGACVLHASAS